MKYYESSLCRSGVVTKLISSILFTYHQKANYQLSIKLTFDGCRHNFALVTFVKYECDSEDPIGTLGKFEIS